jgi:4,5-DOPA dioxygenase extradiol
MSMMPVIFVGHGSPINAIENNSFTEAWRRLGAQIPTPRAILSVSAHWYTRGTKTSDAKRPKMVYDMYGFEEKLYKVQYPAPGAPELVPRLQALVPRDVQTDNSWGIDHGTWSVLVHMFPKADIPLIQLSVDMESAPETHYLIGQALKPLREEGVLVLGSGNIVHNLHRISWDLKDGYPWAKEFDRYVKEAILSGRHDDVVHYERAGASSKEAFYTPDHYDPLVCVLGAAEKKDCVSVFNEACVMGGISMTGYLWE